MDRKKPEGQDKENGSKKNDKENEKKSSSEKDEKKRSEEEILDEEMEDIFHPEPEQVSFSDLSKEQKVEASPHFDEKDYELHRRESFQYHQPLRKLYHKHKKTHKKATSQESQSSAARSSEESPFSSDLREESLEDDPFQESSDVRKTQSLDSQVPSAKPKDEKVQFYVGSSVSLESTASTSRKKEKLPLKSVLRGLIPPSGRESPSQKSEKLQSEDRSLPSSSRVPDESSIHESQSLDILKPKVTFLLGEESRDDVRKVVSEENPRSSRYKHPKRHSVRRKHHGFNIDAKRYSSVLEPEEANTLHTSDIEYLASHRFDDPKGMRRHKVKDKTAVTAFNNQKDEDGGGGFPSPFKKKTFDHEPHELFVELHELKECDVTKDLEWRETARWIKYEEDVELGPDKWGKPHVPPLSFHSLLKLRICLETGAVVLDMDETDLLAILRRVADILQQTDQILAAEREPVLRALLHRHRHVNEKPQPAMRRNSSGYGNLNMLGHDKNGRSPMFLRNEKKNSNSQEASPETVVFLPENNNTNNAEITPAKKKSNEKPLDNHSQILKRVPENSEGAAVLVGQLEFLKHPASVFVRLAEGTMLPHFLEIPIKVRFLFVCLGPLDSSLDYHEVGRSIGTLMSNKDFHTSAYRATSRCSQE